MSLSRDQMLDEMGLSPRWKLRQQPSVARGEKPTHATAATGVPSSTDAPNAGNMAAVIEAPGLSVVTGAESPELIAEFGWDQLRQSVVACRACALCAERKQAVLGVGDEKASWLFVGEGPGAEEDARGEPFVGPAGKLLDAMLAAIDLRRGEDVYIANAVKCRPPGNRTPEAAEMAVCAPYLKRQIALIQPRLIVLLGRAAVQAVLGEEGSLASLRGKTFTYRDGALAIPVVVTYHPAYLLRTLPDKAKSWEDLCRARALMRELAASESATA
ncbi:Phage SPO1 DNA polymerase-related protein [Candidatus Propionivibrio aalborgensis]|uniref:Type-4 uracil-DNA glycosylase n=1 Tax=Candidatus Propionivibrio aalborgensis TaxID=1860101 RepID=A0A1A8XNX4_9RHOO|nr:uracil-DNA glycosylase [Candidatus Propionivibrio aalborgensis]SBT06127.1 Phage SPO1 DNA polymerase-related protein [Candidatus Propionivibrio aalborgensis]